MGLPQGMEWVVIAIVVLVLFGGTKLASLGKNAGKAIREFKEETTAGKAAAVEPPAAAAEPSKPAEAAKPAETPTEQA
jgi:sec-independent protein translocase protein TatA